MKQIKQDVQNEDLKPFYLLYGPERYVLKQYRDLILNTADGFNLVTYIGESAFELQDFISNCETQPFFADRRIILCEGTGLFKGKQDKLLEYLKNIPEFTTVVFVEESLDKRSALFKLISKKGYICEFDYQDEGMKLRFLTKLLKDAGKVMDQQTAHSLISTCGPDLSSLKNEVRKLISYVGERTAITQQDVDLVCVTNPEDKVFEMIDSISAGNSERVLKLLHDLKELQVAPVKILVLLTRQYQAVLKTKALSELPDKEIAKEIGSQYWLIKKYRQAAQGIDVEAMFEACLNAETDAKTGVMEPDAALDVLIGTLLLQKGRG